MNERARGSSFLEPGKMIREPMILIGLGTSAEKP